MRQRSTSVFSFLYMNFTCHRNRLKHYLSFYGPLSPFIWPAPLEVLVHSKPQRSQNCLPHCYSLSAVFGQRNGDIYPFSNYALGWLNQQFSDTALDFIGIRELLNGKINSPVLITSAYLSGNRIRHRISRAIHQM
jgi:hypothetical protein